MKICSECCKNLGLVLDPHRKYWNEVKADAILKVSSACARMLNRSPYHP